MSKHILVRTPELLNSGVYYRQNSLIRSNSSLEFCVFEFDKKLFLDKKAVVNHFRKSIQVFDYLVVYWFVDFIESNVIVYCKSENEDVNRFLEMIGAIYEKT